MHYLVMARCAIDDIPMSLHDGKVDALSAAEELDEAAILRMAHSYNLDTSIVNAVSVLTFDDAGVPQAYETVKRFDDVIPEEAE